MSRKSVRGIFIFFIFFLPVQYGLIGVISLYKSEPWPAFIFPGFKNVYVFDEDTYAIGDLEFHAWCDAGNETVIISPLTLFQDIPRSQSQGFLRTNFSDETVVGSYDKSTREWLKTEAELWYPGHQFTHMEAVWTESYYRRSNHQIRADSTVEISRVNITFDL